MRLSYMITAFIYSYQLIISSIWKSEDRYCYPIIVCKKTDIALNKIINKFGQIFFFEILNQRNLYIAKMHNKHQNEKNSDYINSKILMFSFQN